MYHDLNPLEVGKLKGLCHEDFQLLGGKNVPTRAALRRFPVISDYYVLVANTNFLSCAQLNPDKTYARLTNVVVLASSLVIKHAQGVYSLCIPHGIHEFMTHVIYVSKFTKT